MGSFKSFEEIGAWQDARLLSKQVYQITLQGGWARDFSFRDQIRRAAISVVSNIAEGFDRDGNVEFRRFLTIAKGSAGEVKAQLYVALDIGYIDDTVFKETYELADKTSRMIGGLIKYLQAYTAKNA